MPRSLLSFLVFPGRVVSCESGWDESLHPDWIVVGTCIYTLERIRTSDKLTSNPLVRVSDSQGLRA
jgi:hypothetical protein